MHNYSFPKNIGKFIVIDGIDGSGKTTQLKLLAEKLEKNGFQVEIADFPQYNTKSAGLIEEYLSGKYGTANEVSPYAASCFYACDRYDASHKIRQWLSEGKIVLANRYVTANMGHQGSKITNRLERKVYFDWLEDLEYQIFKIPKPDINIILYLDAEIAQKLSLARKRIDWHNKTRDIHEEHLNHLEMAAETYKQMTSELKNMKLIDCTEYGLLLHPEDIHDKVWEETSKIINAMHHRYYVSHFSNKYQDESDKKNEQIELNDTKIINIRARQDFEIMPKEELKVNTGFRALIPQKRDGVLLDGHKLAEKNIHVQNKIITPFDKEELSIILNNYSNSSHKIKTNEIIAKLLIK